MPPVSILPISWIFPLALAQQPAIPVCTYINIIIFIIFTFILNILKIIVLEIFYKFHVLRYAKHVSSMYGYVSHSLGPVTFQACLQQRPLSHCSPRTSRLPIGGGGGEGKKHSPVPPSIITWPGWLSLDRTWEGKGSCNKGILSKCGLGAETG